MEINQKIRILERNTKNYNRINQNHSSFTCFMKHVGNEPLRKSDIYETYNLSLVVTFVRIDLFALHDWENDRRPISWICSSGKNLKKEIEEVLKNLEDKGITLKSVSKRLSKKCCLREKTIRNVICREWIPLFILELLCKEASTNRKEFEELKSKFHEKIEKLKVNSSMASSIKAVKSLDITLCKIAGAHAADGCICHNEKFFIFKDQFKTNLKIFSNWLKNEFGIEPVIKKCKNKNAWEIAFNNKTFTRFLMKVLGFKNGRKADIVAEPELVRSSKPEFERAFALGVMTFEASINSDRTIGLAVISKVLRDDVFRIVEKSGLNVVKRVQSNLENRKDKWWILTHKLNNDELFKFSAFFEKNSSAEIKIREFLNGFSVLPRNMEEVEFALNKRFSFLIETFELIKRLEITDTKTLSKELKLGKTSIRRHIDLLKMANIVKVTRFATKFDVSLLPSDTRVGLEEDFRNLLFKKIKDKTGSFANLGMLFNESDFVITRWKNGERRINASSLLKLVKIAELPVSELNKNVNSLNKDRIFFNPEIKTWKIPQVII